MSGDPGDAGNPQARTEVRAIRPGHSRGVEPRPVPDAFGTRRAALPWREIATWALLGTFLITIWAFLDVERSGRNSLNFIQPGAKGPSAQAFHEDFPNPVLPDSRGLDGQQFYALARNPFHLSEVAPLLDRPRYRLQRPLLSWLAWALHPTGGGEGLV